jgi:DNA uptake protein ComE-like DNA-binding protein
MRDFLRQFMLYSRSERRAVVALVLLIFIAILIPRVYHFYGTRAQVSFADSASGRDLAVLENMDSASEGPGHRDSARHELKGELFYFDPNTIGIDDWVKLGLTEKQAAVIEKYKGKGGRFRNPDDLRKIFVMSDEMKDRLVPYVRIDESKMSAAKEGSREFYRIEINAADSAAYEALYGIGPALSHRIVKYRGLLGGFYRVEQVGETYGLSDSTFQLIRPHLTVNPALVTRIDINNADYETLRKHPYIHAKIAHAIIGYRSMNGKFESLEQLKTLKPVTEEVYNKIEPYLIVK